MARLSVIALALSLAGCLANSSSETPLPHSDAPSPDMDGVDAPSQTDPPAPADAEPDPTVEPEPEPDPGPGAAGDPGIVGGGVDPESVPSCVGPEHVVSAPRVIRRAPADEDTCGLTNLKLADDVLAAVDRTTDESFDIDGQPVSSCVGVDFNRPLPLGSIRIRASAVANGCGRACEGALCDQGQSMKVFHGVERGTWTYLGQYAITNDLQDYDVAVPGNAETQFVFVCRGSHGVEVADLAIDSIAGVCNGHTPFGTPARVDELSAPGSSNDDPSLTADMLEIYFDTNRSGSHDVWRATRDSVDEPWGEPEELAELNSRANESTPEVSADGLSLWFGSDRMTASVMDIWVAERSSREEPWSAPVLVAGAEVNTTADERGASAAEAGTALFFQSDREGAALGMELYLAARNAVGDPWERVVRLVELSSPAAELSPFATEDARVIYFASDRSGVMDLYVATRNASDEAFGAPVALSSINSGSLDEDPWVSPDGKVIYFASRREGGAVQIYRAER